MFLNIVFKTPIFIIQSFIFFFKLLFSNLKFKYDLWYNISSIFFIVSIMENKSTVRITLGIITFLIGIGLLVFVFILCFNLFGSTFVLSKDAKQAQVLSELTSYTISFFIKIGALIVMTIVASVLTNKGISLTFKDIDKKQ